MGEREPLFNSTMEDILLWRIASHSISQCWGAAAKRGQQGWCRNGTLTPRTSQAFRPWLCLRLTNSSHLCWPTVQWECNDNLKLQMRETVQANHKTGSLLRVRHLQTLLSGVALLGVKPVTTALPGINLWLKPDVECFFKNTALKDYIQLNPDACRAQHRGAW